MEQEKLLMFWVTYRYRCKKRFKGERWKPRYKWKHDETLVISKGQHSISEMVSQHIMASRKNDNALEIRITMMKEIKPLKEAAAQPGIKC